MRYTMYLVNKAKEIYTMAIKAMNIKMDENRIYDIKSVASVFHMTMTEVITEALDEYLSKIKKDPFYRLTAMVQDASEDETAEVLSELENLSDDDLTIVRRSSFQV